VRKCGRIPVAKVSILFVIVVKTDNSHSHFLVPP
jgi:hypothetical protein